MEVDMSEAEEKEPIKRYYFSLNDKENNVLEVLNIDRPITGKSIEDICKEYKEKFG
ncbi:hypothetical protein MBAV_001482 [Candidatus Magnetobacterium bavaricum]|uniref:Uncharacterized protein n=1 Tax=Candidatus Magnetobacterium bavaricum TaxID=29290 RepID=A0A0F3GWV1_9BACT|nr:hypothetical protein MBAV_001482 [Candidatus Magnetobacterium bavaricum]